MERMYNYVIYGKWQYVFDVNNVSSRHLTTAVMKSSKKIIIILRGIFFDENLLILVQRKNISTHISDKKYAINFSFLDVEIPKRKYSRVFVASSSAIKNLYVYLLCGISEWVE